MSTPSPQPGETAAEIAARYGAIARGVTVTVCPKATFSENAWDPVPPREANARNMRKFHRNARMSSLLARERAGKVPEPAPQMVMVSGPTDPAKANSASREHMAKMRAGKLKVFEANKESHKAEIIALAAEGLNRKEVGKRLGLSYKTVSKWADSWGVNWLPPKTTAEMHADAIRGCVAKGFTDKQIGEAIGVSSVQACRLRNALGIPAANADKPNVEPGRNAWYLRSAAKREAATDTIRAMHAEGKSDREIADVIGMSPETTRDWRNRMGLPPVARSAKEAREDFRRLIAERGDEMRAMHAEGCTDNEMAERLGVSHSAARRLRLAMGLGANERRSNPGNRTDRRGCGKKHARYEHA